MLRLRKKDWIEIVLHIAFWVGVFYALVSLTEPHISMRINYRGSTMSRDERRTLSPHLFVTLGFLVLLFYSNIFWLFKKALKYKKIIVRVALPVAWFFAMYFANYYLDSLLPMQHNIRPGFSDLKLDKIKGPPGFPAMVENEHIVQTKAIVFMGNGLFNIILFVFIIVFGLSIAYFFLMEWARAEKFRAQLEAVQLDTEIKFLKSQVNPHFLFNTLNNLFSMAQKKGNDDLADGISKLSGMMRYMIYESNVERVPLKSEIEYLQDCILLNKLRYADHEATVRFNYPPKAEGVFVAPMLFIPFVENAFKHGVVIGQTSHINISLLVNNHELTFICVNEDHAVVKKMKDENSGVGLDNVKRRLELVYPGKHRLQIARTNGQYSVELKIELL